MQFKHYKKYLYMVDYAKHLFIDDAFMNSSLKILVPSYNKYVDIMHIFMILSVHIMNAIVNKCRERKQVLDNIRISVPISAEPIHERLMRQSLMSVLRGMGQDIPVDLTTEPEAAFSYLMSISEQENAFGDFKSILLMDGGDGTFDFVHVEKHEVEGQEATWSKKYGHAFTCAGSEIYQNFLASMKQIFVGVKPEHFNLFLRKVNDWYSKFKTESGNNLIGENFSFDISMIKCEDFLQYLCDASPDLVQLTYRGNTM